MASKYMTVTLATTIKGKVVTKKIRFLTETFKEDYENRFGKKFSEADLAKIQRLLLTGCVNVLGNENEAADIEMVAYGDFLTSKGIRP
jgi:hypothetical protein